MHQNRTPFLPTLINEIQAHIQIIQEVLVLHIPKRHRHPHQLQLRPGQLERVEDAPLRAIIAGARGASAEETPPDLLRRDGNAGAPLGEEGDGCGAEEREHVRDFGAPALEHLSSVVDVANEETVADAKRHGRGLP